MERKLIDIAFGELPTILTLKAANNMLNKRVENTNKEYD